MLVDGTSGVLVSGIWSLTEVDWCRLDGVRGGATTVASDRWLKGLWGDESLAGDLASLSVVAFSSASSVISISLRRRRELEEEVIEPEAVCSKHAEDSALSVRSEDLDSEKTVSWGENLSKTDWNWTVVRAKEGSQDRVSLNQGSIQGRYTAHKQTHKHTFDQPGRVLWDIAENHFPPPVL